MPLKHTFADLGLQPLSETYLEFEQLHKEPFYPLHVYFCENCFLVQLGASVSPQEIFSHYAYFSSSSKGWIKHAKEYVGMIIKKFGLSKNSQIVEIGSNDGYLLQFFAMKGIPVLGVEPASNVAEKAIEKGIPTIVKFFNEKISEELKKHNRKADLIVGNNVIAQVPDINGFVEGLKSLLKPSGLITLEFHHLLKLIDNNQFDTISHERYSYLSFIVIEKVLASHGLTIFDIEEVPTHGGSLRIYARHTENTSISVTSRPEKMRKAEKKAGLEEVEKYLIFNEKVEATKQNILNFLHKAKRSKKSIVGYGAHAEAHTFLNYCGIGTDFLDYTVDRNPTKQGKFLAGIYVPILNPDKIRETKPDYILILPWSIKKEIMDQMSDIGTWGGQFVVAIPTLKLFSSEGTEISNGITIQEEIE